MLHLYSCIPLKGTKNTCWCSLNLVKTHENTSKTVYYMYEVYFMCILVYIGNKPQAHVLILKNLRKYMKTLAN
jgi:hypothetical protein